MTERTPAEIVRGMAADAIDFDVLTPEEVAAVEAVCQAYDREQQRAGQTCGTCRQWKFTEIAEGIDGPYREGDCYRTGNNEREAFSCDAWEAKEASDG